MTGTRDFGAAGGIGGHHSARSRTDVWLTPPPLLAALGGPTSFDLDPCAADPRPWDTARTHYTEADNGLLKPWFGRVWMNPPYSNATLDSWMGRLVEHGDGLALIFARTETQSFFRSVWERADALFFLEGRLTFHLPDGRKGSGNAGAPSVLCAYGRDNADCLAASGLAGAFVPLRLRAFVNGLSRALAATWAAEIDKIMASLGNSATLADLYKAFAGHPKAERNPNYQAKIRQELQRGPYQRVAPGLWERIL